MRSIDVVLTVFIYEMETIPPQGYSGGYELDRFMMGLTGGVNLNLGRRSPDMLEVSLREIAWMDDAACKGMDPKMFFPDQKLADGAPDGSNSYKKARAVCGRCPVIDECLHYSLRMFPRCDDAYGMWGGLSPRERRKYEKTHRKHRVA